MYFQIHASLAPTLATKNPAWVRPDGVFCCLPAEQSRSATQPQWGPEMQKPMFRMLAHVINANGVRKTESYLFFEHELGGYFLAPYVLSDDLRDMPDIEWRIARRDTN